MEKFNVSLVLEILGRPKENVSSAMDSIIDKLSKEKGVTLQNKAVHEPVKVENSEDLFTSFSEIDLEVDSISVLFYVIFAYMPSHIEVVRPEKISLTNSDVNELVNVLTNRLHTYDALAKSYLNEKEYIFRKIHEISPDAYKSLVETIKKEADAKKAKADSSQQK